MPPRTRSPCAGDEGIDGEPLFQSAPDNLSRATAVQLPRQSRARFAGPGIDASGLATNRMKSEKRAPGSANGVNEEDDDHRPTPPVLPPLLESAPSQTQRVLRLRIEAVADPTPVILGSGNDS
jgi:hypothetical protein